MGAAAEEGLHKAVRNHLLSASFLSATGSSVTTGTYLTSTQDADLTAKPLSYLSLVMTAPQPQLVYGFSLENASSRTWIWGG